MLAPLAERFASQRSIEIKKLLFGEVLQDTPRALLPLPALRFTGYIKEAAAPPDTNANDTLLQKLAPKYLTENSFATCPPLL